MATAKDIKVKLNFWGWKAYKRKMRYEIALVKKDLEIEQLKAVNEIAQSMIEQKDRFYTEIIRALVSRK